MNPEANLRFRLLGDMDVRRNGKPVELPRSKKTRALLAYLVVSGRSHRRDSLCSMFWDIPDDPRGALRWSLSKLRPLVDEPERRRIEADRDQVRFDPAGAEIDVLELRRAVARGLHSMAREDLANMAGAFRGAFLNSLDLPNCLDFQAWLVAQRDETRRLRSQVLRALVAQLDAETALPHARTLAQIDHHDEAARIGLIRLLATTGRKLEAEQQFEAAREALGALGSAAVQALEGAWRQINVPESLGVAVEQGPLSQPAATPAPDIFTRPEPRSVPMAEGTALALPEKPSIAVLAFQNFGGETAGEHVAEGISADLIERLGHDPRLFVIARSSTFMFRGRPADPAEVRDALGVRYILGGEVRGVGPELGLTARLSDTVRGETLWNRDFNCPLDSVFALERDLAEAVTQSIDPGASGVPDLTFGLPYPNTDAWVLYQRGMRHSLERSESDLSAAVALFGEALRLDPEFVRAQAAMVDAMYYQVALDYEVPNANWRAAALEMGRAACGSERRDAAVHCALGQGNLIARQSQAAAPAFEAAVELNPSFAWAHYGLGAAKVLSGRSAEALEHLERAIRLSPRDRNMGSFLLRMADAHLFQNRYEDAVAYARRAIAEPLFQWSRYAVLLSALGHLGWRDEARSALSELLEKCPRFSVEMVRQNHLYTDQVELDYVTEPQLFVDQNEFAHYLDGLRKAGVPTR